MEEAGSITVTGTNLAYQFIIDKQKCCYHRHDLQVVARGSVILVQDMSVNGDLATITFTATSQMAPKAMLVVYTIRTSNQEILVDATEFRVDGLFRNNVGHFKF